MTDFFIRIFQEYLMNLYFLIVLCIFVISLIIVNKEGACIIGKKLKFIIFIIILPIFSFIILVYQDSNSTIYLYNESSQEYINQLEYKKNNSKEWKMKKNSSVLKSNIEKINFHTGNYDFRLITTNTETKQKFIVSLNTNNKVLKKNDEIFFCYGGKTFFEFTPSEEDKEGIRKQAESIWQIWRKDISPAENALSSEKTEI